MKDKQLQAANDLALAIIMGICALIFVTHLGGCTIRYDNPFYPPTTMDVNKSSSTGANNYVKAVK